ncbi:hypothetical protein F7725_005758 [Dissostichus mawsoni]|uniref:Uncharacterized protein n=1 Tax=Dissostichus mawsoni TaxID=36200 RepID=A0A7J5YTD9_DISMA|nr:hypothetical protein F7725_005758 [Dissostichus mawsoni]
MRFDHRELRSQAPVSLSIRPDFFPKRVTSATHKLTRTLSVTSLHDETGNVLPSGVHGAYGGTRSREAAGDGEHRDGQEWEPVSAAVSAAHSQQQLPHVARTRGGSLPARGRAGAAGGVGGEQVVLTCLAGGSWPLQYRWTFNNINVRTGPAVQVGHPVSEEDGRWPVSVYGEEQDGSRHTQEDRVLGTFSAEEQRKTVIQGRPAIISLPPSPLSLDPSAITLDNQLVVLATTAVDAGRYYVEAVNERTGENVTSPAVYLSISDPESEVVAPAIVIGPKDTTVVAGSEVTLEPIDSLVVSWKRDGRRLASGRRLVILTPASADTGIYVCEATGKPVEARAQLYVIEPPSLTAQPKRKIIADLDRNVEIPCLATGVPQPRIEWYKDAVPLSKLANPRYKVTAANGLTVRRVQPGDGGIFQCFARNAAGETQAHAQLLVSSMAPRFTFPSSDQIVTDGNTALFMCQTSGAPKPAITWRKGSRVLASGSVQVPRFTLLQTGGLQIRPISFQDSGDYTCIASNAEGSINSTSSLTVWSRTVISVPPTDQRVIKGTTALLVCTATHDPRVNIRYLSLCVCVFTHRNTLILHSVCVSLCFRLILQLGAWGGAGSSQQRGRVSMRQGSLTIGQTWSGDIGDYTCTVKSRAGNDSQSARLEVIELPHSPRSLTARLNDSDSRSVLLSWLRPFDGNSPLLYYLLELSENNSPWKVYLSEVDPVVSEVSVGGLTPARTYQFRLCAVNQVGRGQYSAETQRLMLREEAPSAPPKNIVASGRTNQSIMVQWQPPPEPQLNGVLRDMYSGTVWQGCQGITRRRTSAVAAFTGAGLGVYSSPVTEYTLQGVPTAPPQEVEVLAINSTTIRFTWSPPPQQFINGINQGYKKSPEEVIVVTITPDYPGSRHTGLVSGLKKFNWYFGSTLCFTTPGDGPRSSPILLQTHEDTPGPVRHLSFTEILDTSLRVSWAEPEYKNGIITGYVLWWEVPGVESGRVERTLSNSTLQHQLTGLTSTTLYTLQVAALTAAGRGVLSVLQVQDAAGEHCRLQ